MTCDNVTLGSSGPLVPPSSLRRGGEVVLASIRPDPFVPAEPGDPLRLVRVRVALAMFAMAVLPLAAIAVLAPLVSAPDRSAEQQVGAASSSFAATVSAELSRVRSALLIAAADPASRSLLVSGSRASADARASLGSIASGLGTFLPGASLVDVSGHQRWRVVDGRAIAPAEGAAPRDPLLVAAVASHAGQVVQSDPYLAGQERRLSLAAAVRDPARDGDAKVLGIVRFEVSLSQLVTSADEAAISRAGYPALVNPATGEVVGDPHYVYTWPSQGLLPIPDFARLLRTAASRPGATWSTSLDDFWAVAFAPVSGAVPGFDGWAVLVVVPAPLGPPPLGLILGALLLIGGAALLAAFVARQVVGPAAELQRSRAELERLYELARRDALIDPLTGLGNHRAFQEACARELEQARRHRHPLALMIADLDELKRVNDGRGHAAGDALLASFGTTVLGAIRRGDGAFRIGGDEFAIVMPFTDAAGAEIVTRRLLRAALEPSAGAADDPRTISFTAGIAAAPADGVTATELAARADAALYWGKRHGRTTIELYDASRHHVGGPSPDELDAGVMTVVEGRLLRPVYQPIVDLADGRVIGFEGLVRPQPGSPFADAGSLFAAAESAGRSMELDRVCLDVVAAGATGLGPGTFLTLNLSPRSLEAPDFSAGAVRAMLARHGLPPERVVLEVTEREPIEALERLRANLAACRAAGFRIAADDVGAGNAGLRLLSTVRFDIVKIDLSLVHAGAVRDPALSVLRSLVDLARGWGTLVVAEGIESGAHLRAMRELAVSAGQGYLLGRPGEGFQGPRRVDLAGLEDEGIWPPVGIGLIRPTVGLPVA